MALSLNRGETVQGRLIPLQSFASIPPGTAREAVVLLVERGDIAAALTLGYLGAALDAEGVFRTGAGGHGDGERRFFWEERLDGIPKIGGANVSRAEVARLRPGARWPRP